MSKTISLTCQLALSPPANEVWGKVIFSQACVIPSVQVGGGRVWKRGVRGGGACVAGGHVCQGVCIAEVGVDSRGDMHGRGVCVVGMEACVA